jgi:ribosome-associated protein
MPLSSSSSSSLSPSSELEQTHHWAEVAAQAAASKKADDIVILDVGEVLVITDTFVIASAPNDRLVRTIAEEVEKQLKDAGRGGPRRIEGMREAEWVLLDYGEFVVHVFLEETRRFYDLERLWADAPRVPWVERVPVRAVE